jgi:hypothetical protein
MSVQQTTVAEGVRLQAERGKVASRQVALLSTADKDAALAAMAAALRPGGRLTVLVPAHPRLYGRLDRAYGHHRRYTPERLRAVVEGAGLRVERLYRFNALGVPGWWVRNRTGTTGIGRAPLRVYEALLAAWRPVERRVEPPFGLSLIVHARRPDHAAG